MKYLIYPKAKRKINLKRSRKKILILPILLIVPILILAMFSMFKHSQTLETQADFVKNSLKTGSLTKISNASGEGFQEEMIEYMKVRECLDKEPLAETMDLEEPKIREVKKQIQSGETITSILGDYLDPGQIHTLNKKCKSVFPLHKIKAGHQYKLYFKDDQFFAMEYDIDLDQKLYLKYLNNSFQVSKKNINYNVKKKLLESTIENNLFKAIEKTGESEILAIDLADIFAWDIDFIRDVRKGDSFRLIVTKKFRDGKFACYGKIQAAQFTSQGQTYQAFLFDDGSGRTEYYNAEGQAVRKTFLKAPLNFTRISSGYTWHRRHPILHVVRPHLGIDYAAPRGTPIKSVADGNVIRRAYAKGAGNYIKIRHPNGYVTVYNHMSNYARGIREGTNVEQGQTIGYVGSTGLSTGPHLDYRVKKNGQYMNPLKVKSKPVKPVPDDLLNKFKKEIKPLLAVLNGDRPLYAEADGQETRSDKVAKRKESES